MLRKLLFGVWCVLLVWGMWTTYAASDNVRDLEGIDIISREERGADESLRYMDNGAWNRRRAETIKYEERLAGRGIDRGGKFAARKKNAESIAQKNEYLATNFPKDNTIDFVKRAEGEHELVWPQSFMYKKKKIIVHHTADDDTFATQGDVLEGVRNIYKFHTLTRGRGDVGYNFLIDQFGNIYEGRAGGAGVVAAHAERNNADSIGIALMGNFDVTQPTKEMMDALLRLTTALARKYNINLDAEQTYYRSSTTAPYIATKTLPSSFVGHGDTKATACPGGHVEDQFPIIKTLVKRYLTVFRKLGRFDFTAMQRFSVQQGFAFSWDVGEISIPLVGADPVTTCTAVAAQVQITSCTIFPGRVQIGLKRLAYPASGPQYFLLESPEVSYLVDVSLVWEKDLALLYQQKRADYFSTNAYPSPAQSFPKMITKQPVSDVQQLLQSDARVLLYELTANSPNGRSMTCASKCTVRLDTNAISNATIINVNVANGKLDVYVDLKKYPWIEAVEIDNPSGLVTFGNYERKSYSGVPRNTFKWNISIKKDVYQNLDRGQLTAYTVVNTLSVKDYLRGIAEASDADSIEKIKAMALLVKAYTFYYMAWKNNHPNIPAEASYTMVDDPRIFQKYVGAGYEKTWVKWFEALGLVDGEAVSYKWILPILPYFSCSAGFTFSAAEKRWRTDTPYLKTKLDVASCGDGSFQWHGVGLSGRGAQALAVNGATYKEILQYYYPGIEIVNY